MKAMDLRSKSAKSGASRGLFLVTLTILSLYAASPAAAQPELFLEGDMTAGGELRIGGHLDVVVANAEPLRLYTVLLVDEAAGTVASAEDLMTDEFGKTGPHRLWTRTGVVGCDPEAVHDPASYQFESFSEAESVLGGRTFRVLVVDDPGSPPTKALTRTDLPMVVVTPPVEAYPSDGAGCLRTVLRPAESLHLAISHQSVADQDFMIFVVTPQSVWLPGDLLVDVRPGGPQTINVPAGADPWVVLLWLFPAAGECQLVVRHGIGTAPVFDQATDFAVETLFKLVGSTYPECTVCPP